MKIEKLQSGSYRIRQQYNGKRYSITLPYKPTQKEALKLLSEKMDTPEIKPRSAKSLSDYMDMYITYCEKSGKSPSSIRGYVSIKKNLSADFLDIRFYDITSDDVQRELNSYGETRSAKTVKNAYGLICAVMTKYRPEYTLVVKITS